MHTSTGETPFMLDSGQHPRMGFEPARPSMLESVNEFKTRMETAVIEARAAISKAKDDYARYYNQRRRPAPALTPGDKVWLDSSDIRTHHPSKKLEHRWWGPYEVIKEVGKGAFKLKLPLSMRRLHPVFPVVKLEKALPDPITGRHAAPPPEPVIVNDQVEHEVEQIVNSCHYRGKLQYRVYWKGFGRQDDSWEPEDHLEHAPEHIADYYKQHPHATQ